MPQEQRRAPRSPVRRVCSNTATALAGLLNTEFGKEALPYTPSPYQATLMFNKHMFRVRRFPRTCKTDATGDCVCQKY